MGYAKNVIIFIGDGMGMSTVTAARILKAQQEKKSFHETRLTWEKFPYTSLSAVSTSFLKVVHYSHIYLERTKHTVWGGV